MAIVGEYHKEIIASPETYTGDLHVDLVDEDVIQLSQMKGIEPTDNIIFISTSAARQLRDVLNELLGEQQ